MQVRNKILLHDGIAYMTKEASKSMYVHELKLFCYIFVSKFHRVNHVSKEIMYRHFASHLELVSLPHSNQSNYLFGNTSGHWV